MNDCEYLLLIIYLEFEINSIEESIETLQLANHLHSLHKNLAATVRIITLIVITYAVQKTISRTLILTTANYTQKNSLCH